MANFHNLNNFVARRAAAAFSPDATGAPLLAWFPPDPETLPATRAAYTIEVHHILQGSDLIRTNDMLGNLTQTETRRTLHLLHDPTRHSLGLPYIPTRSTTFLLGTALATATAYHIEEIQHLQGRLSITIALITHPHI